MKKRIYIIGSFLGLLGLSSCYDDSSTLGTGNIGNITFDEGQTNIYIGFQEDLTVSPKLQIAEGTNAGALEYEWALTETTATKEPEYEVIGTEKELAFTMSRPIASAPYTLKLIVTDTSKSDLQYIHSWKVYVQSSFLDGLLISDTKDGSTSDVTLINNKSFTLNYDKEERIFRDILTTANGEPQQGLMRSLAYQVSGNFETTHTNQVWTILEDGSCIRFNTVDYSINGRLSDESMIVDKPAGMKVYSFLKSYTDFFVNTSNGVYSLNALSSTNRFGSPRNDFKNYEINNQVITNSPNTGYTASYYISASKNHINFYNKKNAQFISFEGQGQFMAAKTFEANASFDPNNLPGQTAISATVYEDISQVVFLMKDDTSGTYTIYTLTTYVAEAGYWEFPDDDDSPWIVTRPEQPAAAKAKYTIPSEGKTLLDKAVSVFFYNRNPVLYVVTTDGVYVINYGVGTTATVSTVAKFSPGAGESILKAKMYQQGVYQHDLDFIMDEVVAKTEWNNTALIVATEKGQYEGKVYIIPISQVAAGTLDVSKAKIYDGFGKILDVTTTGY